MRAFTAKIAAVVAACAAGAHPGAGAQTPQPDTIAISLITCYPGSDIYELYGHTMLRVATPSSDVVYNYGVFDFQSPNFIYRFVKGETDYMVAAYPTIPALRGYVGRKVVEQRLNLTPGQALLAKTALETNALPQNRTYRYNYVLDNCATRPRDIIEAATGGTLRYHEPDSAGFTTFRQQMRRYNANYAWQQFGIDLALGSGLDRTISYREQMFVPMILMEAVGSATIESRGASRPAEAEARTILPGSDAGAVLPPTPRHATPMAAALALLAVAAAFTALDIRRRRVCRWLDTLLCVAYGAAGCVMFFLIFISTHEATSPNFNGLWLHPFYLISAALIWIKPASKAAAAVQAIIGTVCLLTLLLWWALPQTANPAFFPLMAVPALRAASHTIITKKLRHDASARNA